MIELLVRLTATAGRSPQLIQALRSVMRSLQLEGVCQAAHTASDVDDQNVVWYFEQWDSVHHFERHLRSKTFDRLLSVVETAATAPVDRMQGGGGDTRPGVPRGRADVALRDVRTKHPFLAGG